MSGPVVYKASQALRGSAASAALLEPLGPPAHAVKPGLQVPVIDTR